MSRNHIVPYASMVSTMSRRATDSFRSLIPVALTESQEMLDRETLREGIEVRPRRGRSGDRCDFCGALIERTGYTCAACSNIQLCHTCYERSYSNETRPFSEERALRCDVTGEDHDWKLYSVRLVYLLGALVFIVPISQVILGLIMAIRADTLCTLNQQATDQLALFLVYAIVSLVIWLPAIKSPLCAIGLITVWHAMLAPTLATVVFLSEDELTTRCTAEDLGLLQGLGVAQYVITGLVWIAVPLSCLNQRSVS